MSQFKWFKLIHILLQPKASELIYFLDYFGLNTTIKIYDFLSIYIYSHYDYSINAYFTLFSQKYISPSLMSLDPTLILPQMLLMQWDDWCFSWIDWSPITINWGLWVGVMAALEHVAAPKDQSPGEISDFRHFHPLPSQE